MIQTPENNLRRESLESLKELRANRSTPVFVGLIKGTVKGRELDILRTRLLSGKVLDHEREYSFQTELLGLMNADLEKAESDIQQEEAFIAKKQEEREQAYQEFLKAKEKLEKADKSLEAAKMVMKDFKAEYKTLQSSIETVKQRKEDINTVVLAHKSASIGQLMSHPLGKVIITQTDSKILGTTFTPDEVFDPKLAEGFFEEMPYEFENHEKNELSSVMDFIQMAMYYYLSEEKQVIMLYADNNIAAVLKKEGVE